MTFNAEITNGIVTAHIAPGAYMDAGRSGEIAGLEFAVERSRMSDAPREQRHANLVMTLDFTPATGRALCYLLAEKMGLPMFSEREWLEIATALELAEIEAHTNHLQPLADRIRSAYEEDR